MKSLIYSLMCTSVCEKFKLASQCTAEEKPCENIIAGRTNRPTYQVIDALLKANRQYKELING